MDPSPKPRQATPKRSTPADSHAEPGLLGQLSHALHLDKVAHALHLDDVAHALHLDEVAHALHLDALARELHPEDAAHGHTLARLAHGLHLDAVAHGLHLDAIAHLPLAQVAEALHLGDHWHLPHLADGLHVSHVKTSAHFPNLAALLRHHEQRQLPHPPASRPPQAPDTHTSRLHLQGAPRQIPAKTAPPQPAAATAPAMPAEAPAEAPVVSEEQHSKRRMAFIVSYVKDPEGHADFRDKPLVFRVVTEERTHQQRLVASCREELGQADLTEERRTELERRMQKAMRVQKELYALLQDITGVHVRRGGENYLPPGASEPGRPAARGTAPPAGGSHVLGTG